MNIPKITADDIVEVEEFIGDEDYNPHNIHPWLLHDQGFTIAVCFASCLQDALDSACDNDKLERYLVSEDELRTDYDEDGRESLSSIGNGGELHDIESLEVIELPNVSLKQLLVEHYNSLNTV